MAAAIPTRNLPFAAGDRAAAARSAREGSVECGWEIRRFDAGAARRAGQGRIATERQQPLEILRIAIVELAQCLDEA